MFTYENHDPLQAKHVSMPPECHHKPKHLNPSPTKMVEPRGYVCEECIRTGSKWVHLRMCMECGHIGCCNSSPNIHATKHFIETGHALMRSIEPGEDWAWCYRDEVEGTLRT